MAGGTSFLLTVEIYKLGVQNTFIFVKEGEWIERKHSKLYVPYMYESEFNRVNRGSRRYILRGLFQGSVSHDCGVWLGSLKTIGQVVRGGWLELSGMS